MSKLFAVMLGGKAKGAAVEVHDVVFTVADTIKAAFPDLRKKWFGVKSSAHVDAWVELSHVDGFRVSLTKSAKRAKSKEKLFCINIGSYASNVFGEMHDYFFLVSPTANDAKKRAKALVPQNSQVHVDNVMDVDDCIEVGVVNGFKVELTPAGPTPPLKITHVYWPIK